MYDVIIVEDEPMVAMINRGYVSADRRFHVAAVLRDGEAHPEEERRFPALTDPCYSPHFSRKKADFQLNLDEHGRNVF